ncbi:MAG: transcriptional regulator [Calditrichaceae bacterium]|nr:transcriptional regulator [Calditrichaceae bacterium]MBN2710799.1 transcriptional regulator [Calditrichaceae bacterium]RQV94719.1 MAG: transcriptional regulator [Calditrichota bacterium]
MKPEQILELDAVVHTPIRLAILSILTGVESADFTFLKKTINTTDGNLSTHLSKLEEAGYITITKSFKGKRPLTTCSISETGRKAFLLYINQLEQIIKMQKS